MKVLLAAVVIAVVVVAQATAFTFEEENMARYAVGTLGPTHTLVRIKNIKTQVVTGTMYHIYVRVRAPMPGSIGGNVQDCYIKLWKKLDGSIKVSDSQCDMV